ncbi:MAG: alternative ribosome rescue aminoacyl-tRNA hydrolase ArfB [Gemmatimonadales bacterium]
MRAFTIPLDEITLKATRASGPGGQHVNKTSSRIEAVWNVFESPTLAESQRARILRKLGTRIDGRGNLRVVSDAQRSQVQNRAAAIARLQSLVATALVLPKVRRPTKPTKGAVERRIAQKKAHGARKRDRRKSDDD